MLLVKKSPPMVTDSCRVEKYRPVYLDDVVGNTETIERLKIIAKDGNMPHMIISGMPGIGKTTSILCLARQLLGDAYKVRTYLFFLLSPCKDDTTFVNPSSLRCHVHLR
jgi:replication-associated recombination protein RarA